MNEMIYGSYIQVMLLFMTLVSGVEYCVVHVVFIMHVT